MASGDQSSVSGCSDNDLRQPVSSGQPEGAAESAALDPDLAAVVAAWPTLPEPIRRAILTLVAFEPASAATPTDPGERPRVGELP